MTSEYSENDLLEKIGIELAESEMLIAPPSKEMLIKKGRQWFEKRYDDLEIAVCSNKKVESIFSDPESDVDTIVAAIADLISSICISVSPFTVAQLLIKKGLKTLCKDYWK